MNPNVKHLLAEAFTAAAVAAALSVPADAQIFNNAFNFPPEALRAMSDANDRRQQQHQHDDRLSPDDVRALTDDELDEGLRQNRLLIENIRSNAGQDGRLSARDERRLSEVEESLAVFQAEDERRRAPIRRTTPGPSNSADAAQRGASVSMPTRQASQPHSNRMGVLLNAATLPHASASIFGAQTERSPWRNNGEFVNVLMNRMADPRLLQAATNVEGVGVDGGFIVPGDFFRGILDPLFTGSQFAQRCRLFGSSGNTLSIPMLDAKNRTDTIAGIRGNWVSEGSQQTAQKIKFRMVEQRLKKIMILAEATNELEEDAVGYAAYLQAVFAENGAVTLDEALYSGTGVGQPLGVLNSPSALQIAPESGQAADTLRYQNLVDLYSRVHPTSQQRGAWFYSPDALPQLLKMVFPGSDQPVLLSGSTNDAAAGAPAGTIFGRPAYSSEHLSQLGDKGDIAFIDWSQYALLMKGGARVDYDGGPGFDRDVATWRLRMRADGVPLWDAAITPRNGGSTLSWAVYLGAR